MPPPIAPGAAPPLLHYNVPGFAIDIKNLLHQFAQKRSASFALFKSIWKDMQFTCVHTAAPKQFEAEYLQSLFSGFLTYLLMYSDMHVRSGVMFGLYCLYRTQRSNPPDHIKIDLTLWRELKGFADACLQQDFPEPYAAFEYLFNASAFMFCAHIRYGVATGDSVARDNNRAFADTVLPSDLMRTDTLSGVVNPRAVYELEEQYQLAKSSFVSAAHQTLDASLHVGHLDRITQPLNVARQLAHVLQHHEKTRIAGTTNLPRHAFPPLTSTVGSEFVTSGFSLQELMEATQSRKKAPPPAQPVSAVRRVPTTGMPVLATAMFADEDDSDTAQDMPSFRGARKTEKRGRRRRSQSPSTSPSATPRGRRRRTPTSSATASPTPPPPPFELSASVQPVVPAVAPVTAPITQQPAEATVTTAPATTTTATTSEAPQEPARAQKTTKKTQQKDTAEDAETEQTAATPTQKRGRKPAAAETEKTSKAKRGRKAAEPDTPSTPPPAAAATQGTGSAKSKKDAPAAETRQRRRAARS